MSERNPSGADTGTRQFIERSLGRFSGIEVEGVQDEEQDQSVTIEEVKQVPEPDHPDGSAAA